MKSPKTIPERKVKSPMKEYHYKTGPNDASLVIDEDGVDDLIEKVILDNNHG